MGADSLCIKDMAGLIAPDDAYKLIKALKKVLKIPGTPTYPLHQRYGVDELPESYRGGGRHY